MGQESLESEFATSVFTAFRWRTSESDDEIPYSHHGYAYALGNPVLYTDPGGTCVYTEDRNGCAGSNFGAQILAVINQYGVYSHLYDTQQDRRIYDASSAAYRFMDAHPAEAAAYMPPHPEGQVDPVLASAIDAYGYGSYEDGINELRYVVCNWQIDHGGPCSGGVAIGAIAAVVPFGADDCTTPYARNGGSLTHGRLNPVGDETERPTSGMASLGSKARIPEEQEVLDMVNGVNPTGSRLNCTQCAEAANERFAGNHSAVAGGGVPRTNSEIEALYPGRSFQRMSGPDEIRQKILAGPEGTRGIVTVRYTDPNKMGHAFNALKYKGSVYFVDAQGGVLYTNKDVLNWDKYYLLQTYP